MLNLSFIPSKLYFTEKLFFQHTCAAIGLYCTEAAPIPMKKSQNIGFLSNSGPDPLKNHKATKLAFNVGPLSARQQNTMFRHLNGVSLAGRWMGRL